MKIQVSQLQEGQNSFKWSSDKEPGLGEFYKKRKQQGYDLAGPLLLDLDITRLEPDYYVRGRMKFALSSACAKCGEPIRSDINGPFELALVRADKIKAPPARLAEEADDLDLICFSGNELQLDPILEEQFLLNVPFQAECGTVDCLERTRVLMQKVQDQADHWKNSPFTVLKDLKKSK